MALQFCVFVVWLCLLVVSLATRLVLGQVRQVKVGLSDIWHHFQPDFSSADRRHILLSLPASWTPGRLIELSLRFSLVSLFSLFMSTVFFLVFLSLVGGV